MSAGLGLGLSAGLGLDEKQEVRVDGNTVDENRVDGIVSADQAQLSGKINCDISELTNSRDFQNATLDLSMSSSNTGISSNTFTSSNTLSNGSVLANVPRLLTAEFMAVLKSKPRTNDVIIGDDDDDDDFIIGDDAASDDDDDDAGADNDDNDNASSRE